MSKSERLKMKSAQSIGAVVTLGGSVLASIAASAVMAQVSDNAHSLSSSAPGQFASARVAPARALAESAPRQQSEVNGDAEALAVQSRIADAVEWQTLIGGGALALSIVGAIFLGYTLVETRRSVRAATRAADAADKSAKAAELGVRPVVVPLLKATSGMRIARGEAEGLEPQVEFTWANYGKTPAFLRFAKYEIQLISELPQERVFVNPQTKEDQTVIAGEQVGGGIEIACSFGRKLNAAEMRQLRAKLTKESQRTSEAARLHFMGFVQYSDVFGKMHETGFCLKLFANSASAMRGGSKYNYTRVIESEVGSGNFADSETEHG